MLHTDKLHAYARFIIILLNISTNYIWNLNILDDAADTSFIGQSLEMPNSTIKSDEINKSGTNYIVWIYSKPLLPPHVERYIYG